MVCGTAALHDQASTAVQQLVLENRNNVGTTAVVISESVVILNEVVVMCVAVRCALFEFDTLISSIKMAWRYFVEKPT